MTIDLAVPGAEIVDAEIVDAEIVDAPAPATDLAVPETEIADAELVDEPGPAIRYEGVIAIEWPAPPASRTSMTMPGWKISIYDALNGRQIMTVTKIEVHASASGLVTADLTMFADADGRPVYEWQPGRRPGTIKVPALEGGRPREGTYPFLVAEMRVREG